MTQSHYTTLGLLPSAAPEVIRAAYKAICLISHPDKTMHLGPQERALHAATFKDVQQAYDVLGNPSMKAAYDTELKRINNKMTQGDTEHQSNLSYPNQPDVSAQTKRKTSVKLTTPEQKTALRAKAHQSMEYLRDQRTKRDAAESQMEIVILQSLVRIWTDLAEENKHDPPMHAHCAIRIHEYNQKIAEREREHEEWLTKMSTAKCSPAAASKQRPSTPNAPKKPTETLTESAKYNAYNARRQTSESPSPPVVPRTQRAKDREQAEASRAAAAADRSQARLLEKAQREANKQAQLEQKQAAIQAEKAKQRARVEQKTAEEAQRIAKARAKAGATPLNNVEAIIGSEHGTSADTANTQVVPTLTVNAQPNKPGGIKHCTNCSVGHGSLREWRLCNSLAAAQAKDLDGSLFELK